MKSLLISLWFYFFEYVKNNPLVQKKGNDIMKKRYVLREGDMLTLNTKNYLNYFSSSINFSSNNWKIKLPGIREDINDGTYLKDQDLNSIKIIHHQIYMIALHKDKRKIMFYMREQTEEMIKFIPFDLPINVIFSESEYTVCNDIEVVDEYLFVLCYDSFSLKEKIIDRNYSYKIFMINLQTSENELEDVISTFWMSNPKFKLFSQVKAGKKLQDYELIMYDKEDNPHIQLDHGKQLLLFKISKNSKDRFFANKKNVSEFLIEDEKLLIKIDDFIFNGVPTSIKLQDLYIISEKAYEIVFVYKVLEENQQIPMYVISCEIYNTKNIKDLLFEKCKKMIEKPITYFNMDQNFYVYTSLSNTMKQYLYFGTKYIHHEKQGYLDDTWEIIKIIVQDARAYMFIEVNKNYLLFQNNFIDNSLTWIYYDIQDQNQFSVFLNETLDSKNFYLLGIKNRGFIMKNITIHYDIQIYDTSIESLDPVLIYLDDQIIMELDVIIWNGEQVLNKFKDQYDEVSIAENGIYYQRLGFEGKNIFFNNNNIFNENQIIIHYNEVQFVIAMDQHEIFKQKNIEYRITKATNVNFGNPIIVLPLQVITLKCKYYDYDFKYYCVPKEFIRVTSIDLEKLDEVTQTGSLMIISQKNIDNFVIINTITNKQVKLIYQEKINEDLVQDSCIYKDKYFYCIYQDHDQKLQYLKAFQVQGNKMVEIKGFSEKFKKLVLDYKKEQGIPVDEIEINEYKNDEIHPRYIIVIFNFISDSIYYTKMFQFTQYEDPNPPDIKITHYFREQSENPSVQNDMNLHVTNHQVLMYRINPKFKMFCVRKGSIYNFDYLDIKKLIAFKTFFPASLMLFFYESNEPIFQDNTEQVIGYKLYYALIRNKQDASKQLIRLEHIGSRFNRNLKVTIFGIDEEKVLILFYQSDTYQIVYSYVYFRYGPAIVSKKIKPIVGINNQNFEIKNKIILEAQREVFFYKDDSNIVLSPVMQDMENCYVPETYTIEDQEDDNEFQVQKDVVHVDILNHINIFGNLKGFKIVHNIENFENLKILQPLEMVQKKHLIGIDNSNPEYFQHSLCQSYDKFLVYQNTPGVLFNLMYSENTQKVVSIKFDIDHHITCDQTFLTDRNFYCFYNQDFSSYGVVRSVQNLGQKQKIFKVQKWGKSITVPEDNENFSLIVHAGHYQKSLVIEKWLKHQNSDKTLVATRVGLEALRVDDLEIFDYHVTVHTLRNRLTVFILDRSSNRIIIDYRILDSLKSFIFLNNIIELNQYGTDFRNITCADLDNNNFQWSCKIFSDDKILKMKVFQRLENEGVSEFSFDHEVDMQYLSPFQLNILDSGFNILDVEIEQFLFIVDKNPYLKQREVVMYQSINKMNQAYYILKLDEGLQIKDMNAIKEGDNYYLILFLQNARQLFFQKYKISEYKLQMIDAYKFIDQVIDLEILFQRTTFSLKFIVEKFQEFRENKDDRVRKHQKIFMAFIIIEIVLCMILLFLIFIANQQRKLLRIKAYAQLIKDEVQKSEYFESQLSSYG